LEEKELNFHVEPRLLDHISIAMYSDLNKAIGELLANCYDADSEIVKVALPEKIKEDSRIIIEDDGAGMDLNDIKDHYLHIGADNRPTDSRTPKFKRLVIGSKGIGKFAGLGICKNMQIITVKNNVEYKFEIDRTTFEVKETSLEKTPIPYDTKSTDQPNGTKIILYNFRTHIKEIDIEQLRFFLATQFGFFEKFNIIINGKTCEPKDIPGREVPIKLEKDPIIGKINGYVIIAERAKDVRIPGIITKVRGRPVHGPSLFDINAGSHKYRVADRLIGYVEVTDFDPIEKREEIDDFTIITSREGFNKSSPKYQQYKNFIEEELVKICKDLEREYRQKRKDKFEKRIKEEIKAGPDQFLDFIANLNFEEIEEDAQEYIFEFLKKITRMREGMVIIDELKKASDDDIIKIAGLLQKWGLQEVALIIEIIKGRLDALEKFDEVVNDETSLELKDIHPVLENNLWLLDDNYRLFASNTSIKKIVGDKIVSNYKGDGKKRPDLICNSLLDNMVIIELKRPSHKIDGKDFAQVIQYRKIIQENSPKYINIDVFLVGSKFDEAIRDPKLRYSRLFLISFSELVESAKLRYDEILNILEKTNRNK